MSINRNSNNNEREQRRTFFALGIENAGAFMIPLILLASGGVVLVSSIQMTSALAQVENDTSQSLARGIGTTALSSPSGIELSPQPVYQEHITNQVETPINQTHFQLTYSGNGTLTLPNSTETVKTTSTGDGLVSMIDGSFVVKGILTSQEDRSESATATFYGIVRFNPEDGSGRGIVIALLHTNSTDRLAPLDGMILTGQMELPAGEERFITFWEWQSGIPYVMMPPTQESIMNATVSP